MEIIIKVAIFSKARGIRTFLAQVDESNYLISKKKLQHERDKIINHLKMLKRIGEISSIRKPKNKKIQKKLNEFIKAKKTIKESINKINAIFN